MKAIRIHAHGGVEQLRVEDLEEPRPGPRQIVIEVRAAALNHLDLWVRKGIPGLHLPLILGSDAAGVGERPDARVLVEADVTPRPEPRVARTPRSRPQASEAKAQAKRAASRRRAK